MNRAQFLSDLKRGLAGLPAEEIEEIVNDYDTHFADGIAAGRSEESIAEALGKPARLFGDRRRESSWAHQIATAVLFTSSLLVYGGHPQSFLDSPALEIIRNIPATWDETIVLPPSEIGDVAVMARRKGREWFVAAANGATARTVRVPLTFLGGQQRNALIARDDMANAAAVKMERMTLSPADTLAFELRAGGGFVARLVP